MLVSDNAPTLHDLTELYGEELWDTTSPYPIWDEEQRAWLQSRIVDHFEYRRIAQDTGALFVKYLNRRMREMMPTLNPIFAVLYDEKPDIMRSYATKDESENTAGQESQQVYSDTPQAQLLGNKDYATNLTNATGTNTGTSTSVHSGVQGTVGEQLTKWVSGVNNALYLVFNGLEPLFNQIYDEEGF